MWSRVCLCLVWRCGDVCTGLVYLLIGSPGIRLGRGVLEAALMRTGSGLVVSWLFAVGRCCDGALSGLHEGRRKRCDNSRTAIYPWIMDEALSGGQLSFELAAPLVESADPSDTGHAEGVTDAPQDSVIDEQAIKQAVETVKARLAEQERRRARRLAQVNLWRSVR